MHASESSSTALAPDAHQKTKGRSPTLFNLIGVILLPSVVLLALFFQRWTRKHERLLQLQLQGNQIRHGWAARPFEDAHNPSILVEKLIQNGLNVPEGIAVSNIQFARLNDTLVSFVRAFSFGTYEDYLRFRLANLSRDMFHISKTRAQLYVRSLSRELNSNVPSAPIDIDSTEKWYWDNLTHSKRFGQTGWRGYLKGIDVRSGSFDFSNKNTSLSDSILHFGAQAGFEMRSYYSWSEKLQLSKLSNADNKFLVVRFVAQFRFPGFSCPVELWLQWIPVYEVWIPTRLATFGINDGRITPIMF
jgi:hypothetical protein